MRRLMLVMAAALALSACSHGAVKPEVGGGAPVEVEGIETITYETGPCFGACPLYKVSVSSDGHATFTGLRNTAVIGERKFQVTPEQYLAFRAEIEPWLPLSGDKLYRPGTPLCHRAATDLPSVDIRIGGGVRNSHLYYYYGCDIDKNAPMGEALGNATSALPLDQLVGAIP